MEGSPTPGAGPIQLLRLTESLILHQALYAAAVLGIADLLNEGPRPVAQLAKLSDVDEDALFRTLRYLSGLIDAGYPGQTPTLIRAQPDGAHKDASERHHP